MKNFYIVEGLVSETSVIMIKLMFCVGVASLMMISSHRKHVLSTLLSLEFMALICFFLLLWWAWSTSMMILLPLVFLVFIVCEGSLGLAILVTMVQTHGNDYFQGLNVL